jgi:hypothetical protein
MTITGTNDQGNAFIWALAAVALRPKGAMVKVELPIHISKVSPMADGKPTRVRFTVKADGTKVRVAAKGGKELGAVSPSRKSKKAK